MAAGHYVIRWSGPNQNHALVSRVAHNGFSRSNGSTVSHQGRHHPLQSETQRLHNLLPVSLPPTFRRLQRLLDVHDSFPSWSAPPRRTRRLVSERDRKLPLPACAPTAASPRGISRGAHAPASRPRVPRRSKYAASIGRLAWRWGLATACRRSNPLDDIGAADRVDLWSGAVKRLVARAWRPLMQPSGSLGHCCFNCRGITFGSIES